jgi:PAS domain-containing protein
MSGWGEWSARETQLKHAGTGGVALGTISASYLWNFYGNFEVGRHSGITLLYADGHVIARNPDNANAVGRNLSHKPLFRNLSLQSTSGTYNFIRADETERVSFFRRSDRFPLVLLATMQYGELLAPWRNAAISRMSFVLALVMLNAIIGFFLVRQAQRGQRLAWVLAFEEANFRLLAEGSNDMVTRIGLDDLVSYASPSSVRIVGWRPDQLVGTSAPGGDQSARPACHARDCGTAEAGRDRGTAYHAPHPASRKGRYLDRVHLAGYSKGHRRNRRCRRHHTRRHGTEGFVGKARDAGDRRRSHGCR